MKKSFAAIIFMMSITNLAFCQTPIWEIVTKDNQPYKDVVLKAINGDTLFVKTLGQNYPVAIDSIKYMRHEQKSYAGVGAVAGAIGGGIIGNQLAKGSGGGGFFYAPGQMYGTLLGAIAGGIVGAATASGLNADQYYNFENKTPDERRIILAQVIAESDKQLAKQKEASERAAQKW